MAFKLPVRETIIVILLIILFFSFDGCSRIANFLESETVVETKTTTKIDTSTTKKTFIDIKPMPDYFKPTPVKVEIKDGKVNEVPDSTPIDSSETSQVKEVNKYTTVSELENGTITGTFLVEGKLLSTEFKLDTEEKVITKETETIKTVVRSGLFGEGQTTFGFDGRVKDIAAGVSYYHKGNISIGSLLQYDVDPIIELPPEKRVGVVLKFAFKF